MQPHQDLKQIKESKEPLPPMWVIVAGAIWCFAMIIRAFC